jgi:hypothetical protein
VAAVWPRAPAVFAAADERAKVEREGVAYEANALGQRARQLVTRIASAHEIKTSIQRMAECLLVGDLQKEQRLVLPEGASGPGPVDLVCVRGTKSEHNEAERERAPSGNMAPQLWPRRTKSGHGKYCCFGGHLEIASGMASHSSLNCPR